ncbi:MAG: hypothetical protein ACE5IQ_12650 [Candidatus Methylomirabilales bacterium]
MLRSLVQLVFGSRPVSFESPFSVNEAVRRLAASVSRSVFRTVFREAVIGKVAASRVMLYRYRPFLRNSFLPVFVGSFQFRNGVTKLDGRFSMHGSVKVFMACWFGMSLLLLLVAGISWISNPAQTDGEVSAVTVGLGMVLFGIALVFLGERFGRPDVEYISAVIRQAIGVDGVHPR